MSFIHGFYTGIVNGLREVWAHKFRSFLSMIGIILGVAALVAMVGVVRGMIQEMRIYFESAGGINRIYVEEKEPPDEQLPFAHLSPGRTYKDAIAVEQGSTFAELVSPEVNLNWKRYQIGRDREHAPTRGVLPEKIVILDQKVAEGRFIGDLDVERSSPVVVIGGWLRDEFFDEDEEALGQTIKINRRSFKIIGVLEFLGDKKSRQNPFYWKNRVAYMPITTAMKRFNGNDDIQELNVHIKDVSVINEAVAQVENILLQTHRGIRDFEVRTMEEQLAEFKKLESSFTLALGGVAGISLLVGGLGIMNVMLAVINERIREIGVRKAVGARGFDIFIQFVAESVVISVLGGIIGMIVSVGFVNLLKEVVPDDKFKIILSPDAMIAGFVFSVVIGVCAGIYPALKAARLDVIDALRYE
ncbi:ABC transporter permease [Rubellicoccus peritrichatus]|uniref:ABC transporter permease n=1 Tax=Rubellicoccus peritrichatus TaxID=3080537 RepID=A0AAQ3LAJ2_9BACT|nr:ABC transporter permease [Puniceicoccus sp. CR14]WOO41891.1 ABC transporter permease [Puniceicoccus sp. CR14]